MILLSFCKQISTLLYYIRIYLNEKVNGKYIWKQLFLLQYFKQQIWCKISVCFLAPKYLIKTNKIYQIKNKQGERKIKKMITLFLKLI